MKPKIGITIGDPNGIGAELILRLINLPNIKKYGDIYIISPINILNYYSKKIRIEIPENINIIDFSIPEKFRITPGKIDATSGKIAGESICKAVKLIQEKKLDSLLTMPISKIALQLGGYNFSGHTEMLKYLTKSADTFMFMYYDKRIFSPLTIHIPLKQVPATLTKDFFIRKVRNIFREAEKLYSIKNLKIAILSLNPHSGENNVIGNEEIKIFIPAIKYLRKNGIRLEGPFSADGFFGFQKYKDYHITIGMYHDQIMIPFKILAKKKGVNITAGLKFVRTSPSHGTAFDIAGKGIADVTGAFEALKINYFFTKKIIT